jgi:hypothetical protein
MSHPPIMCDRLPAQSRDASAGRASSDLYVDLRFEEKLLATCHEHQHTTVAVLVPPRLDTRARAAMLDTSWHRRCTGAHTALCSGRTAQHTGGDSGAAGGAPVPVDVRRDAGQLGDQVQRVLQHRAPVQYSKGE